MANKSKLDDNMRSKIEEVAALDGSVEEMAYFCDVSRQTIYNWLEEDEVLFDKVERLRARPVLKARQTVNKKMTETYSNAADYLKRKARKEFGDNVDHTSDGKVLPAPIIPLDGSLSRNDSDEEDSILK